MEKKGTVTSLSSVFPTAEAQKASRRVQDTIAERQQLLHQLNGFIADNTNLINLVHRLPDELHHEIMVPFGKAAFFPGRLIHTNEFMVLLGEGYYAERTSKQAAEILKRRGKALESQAESLKAMMQDLKVEASFFDATASEASEGLVEIREDYVEEGSSGQLAKTGSENSDSTNTLEENSKKVGAEDEEYERILARMAELEKEEEAENSNESDVDEGIQSELDTSTSQISVIQDSKSPQVEALEVPAITKDVTFHGNHPAPESSMTDKTLEPKLLHVDKEVQSPITGRDMAFTGSIVEHAHNIGRNSTEQPTGGRSSRPVSRFKMQRK
ncbi:hypothetical protein ACJIZ3_013823 [Penstemon smallii]|uniref:RNA polymerase II subunit 5-mediating protein homolog n=1 Tax=Penstemon smallii TaxID=265156 RepID=A0ABD3RHS4_9LAMI